jgi:hypothetical protein
VFRDDPEHHRSIATLATRLCGKVFGFVKRNYPERSGGRMPLAGKGVRGKGRQPLSPPQHTVAPKRDQRFGDMDGRRSAR